MGVFDGMSREQLGIALGSAQLALIELMSGKANAALSYTQGDGAKSVTKRVTTVAECNMLIQQLQRALGIGGRRRTIGFVFR